MIGTLKFNRTKRATGPVIDGPQAAYEAVQDIADLEQEVVVAVLLNQRNRSLGRVLVTVGTVNQSLVSPRELFREAILANAVAIVIAHNHPSGDARPSREDIDLTLRMVRAGEIIGIRVLDHIVVGDGTFTSLQEAGHI